MIFLIFFFFLNIYMECTDVNLVVRQYDASLSSLLDKHCLFVVCFVGLFHIGNWNFWLVMA